LGQIANWGIKGQFWTAHADYRDHAPKRKEHPFLRQKTI
jgi:hypothetical protein